jgi:hypothetical protein
MNEKQRVVKNRLRVLEHAKKIGNIRKPAVISAYPGRAFIVGRLLTIGMAS